MPDIGDGHPPSKEVIKKWLKIVDDFFDNPCTKKDTVVTKQEIDEETKEVSKKILSRRQSSVNQEKRIAVHCVSGLGRAPLLVALALIHKGKPAVDVIHEIR